MRKLIAFLAAAVGGIAAFMSLRWLMKSREDTAWEEASRPGKVIGVDGVAVHYVDSGSGPPLVMIHGFAGHTYSFRHQIAEFSRDHRCIAIDLMGFGYSGRPTDADYSLEAQANLVLHTLDALEVGTFTLAGHSLGGEVAMRIAAKTPERVEKLILVASVPGVKPVLLPRLSIFRPFLRPAARLTALNAWRNMFYDASKLDTDAIRSAYIKPMRIQGTGNTVWEMWRDVRHDPVVDFKRITMPTLILWAEKERIIPFPGRAYRHLQKKLPHAETAIIPRTGHLLLEENPADANEAIHRFLAGQPVAEVVPPEGETAAQPA
jgi:pimeloyl-ACP methyl ester carboxylesterase